MGSKLWYKRRDALLARLNEGASIGMDGVVDMQPFYEKGGFQIAFRDERHEKIGEELYNACPNSVIGELLYLDIPMVNTSAVNLAKI